MPIVFIAPPPRLGFAWGINFEPEPQVYFLVSTSMKHSFWWKKALVFAGVSGLAAGTANADITINFTNQTWTGFQFSQIAPFLGPVTGTLTGVSVNATLDASTLYTYANDLTIYVDPLPLNTGGLLQVGGWSNLGAAQRLSWANGNSSAPGTTVIDSKSVNSISFTGTASDPAIWLGNGYGASGTSGTWTGSITLVGINAVPEPTSTGLLIAGSALAAAGIRRRRV